MRRLLAGTVLLVAAGSAATRASELFVSPDVPTKESAQNTTLLPGSVSRYDGSIPSYTPVLSLPGNPTVDAIHKLDRVGAWLFSLESANNLAGALPAPAEGRDVIRHDAPAALFELFFCGGAVSGAIPPTSNVDAILVDGGDAGDLWVSFDVPTTIGASTFDPADLVAYRRTGIGCAGWTLAAGNPVFNASAAGGGVPLSANVVGAAKVGPILLLTFDAPADLGPPLSTFTSNEIAAWDGVTWSVGTTLSGWPGSSVVDGLSGVGNPGDAGVLKVARSLAIPGNLDLTWGPSCSEGGTDYGIYEGKIGTWYSHVAIACTDVGHDLAETVAPGSGNRYYLVVARNGDAEGSYGRRSGAIERPVGGGACVGLQVVTPCP